MTRQLDNDGTLFAYGLDFAVFAVEVVVALANLALFGLEAALLFCLPLLPFAALAALCLSLYSSQPTAWVLTFFFSTVLTFYATF